MTEQDQGAAPVDQREKFRWTGKLRPDPLATQISAAWGSSALLDNIEPRVARKLVDHTHVRSYRAGEALFREGETGVAAALLIKGTVAIESTGHLITELAPGTFFGEVALLEDAPRTASAIARSDVLVSFLMRYQLEEFVRHRPQSGLQIMTNLARLLALRLHAVNGGEN